MDENIKNEIPESEELFESEEIMEDTEAGLVPTEKGKRFSSGFKKFREIIGKIGARNMVAAVSLLLIGTAVILNFVMFGNSQPIVGDGDMLGAGLSENEGQNDSFVDDTYFASAQLSRKQARDQALAVLQSVVDSTGADAFAKEQASVDISRIASEIQAESNIEALMQSKGFEKCVAVIGEGSASIIVRSDGLLPNELSQIKEIVYEQAGIDPVGIKIIEQNT